MWSATGNHDDGKNAKPAVATDDFIATETPEKKAEEMNSVEEENKTNSDESEQAPPTSVTKVTVRWMTVQYLMVLTSHWWSADLRFLLNYYKYYDQDTMKSDYYFFLQICFIFSQILTFLWMFTVKKDV